MRHLVAAAAIAFASIALPSAARAEIEYPYCAYGREGGGGCMYATLDQCRAFVNGTGGDCYNNPRYMPGANAVTRAMRGRR